MCRFVHSATMEDRQAWIKRRRESKLLNGRIKDDTIPLHVKKVKVLGQTYLPTSSLVHSVVPNKLIEMEGFLI